MGGLAALFCAPAIIPPGVLMPVKPVVWSPTYSVTLQKLVGPMWVEAWSRDRDTLLLATEAGDLCYQMVRACLKQPVLHDTQYRFALNDHAAGELRAQMVRERMTLVQKDPTPLDLMVPFGTFRGIPIEVMNA